MGTQARRTRERSRRRNHRTGPRGYAVHRSGIVDAVDSSGFSQAWRTRPCACSSWTTPSCCPTVSTVGIGSNATQIDVCGPAGLAFVPPHVRRTWRGRAASVRSTWTATPAGHLLLRPGSRSETSQATTFHEEPPLTKPVGIPKPEPGWTFAQAHVPDSPDDI